jgi:hypothetical protein
MQARLALARGYTLLFLKVGPNYQPPDRRPPEQAAIIKEHGRRNMQLREDGKMALVGPVSGAPPIVGLCIFTVPEDEARELMRADPAVNAGLFVVEYATWYGVPGDGLPAA